MRLIFFVEVKCIFVESASYFRSDFCLSSRLKYSRSRFDKFNHVKYTKTLSVRNRRVTNRLLFFALNAPNAHKGRSIARFLCAHRTVFSRFAARAKKARRAFFGAAFSTRRMPIFRSGARPERAIFRPRKHPRKQQWRGRHGTARMRRRRDARHTARRIFGHRFSARPIAMRTPAASTLRASQALRDAQPMIAKMRNALIR